MLRSTHRRPRTIVAANEAASGVAVPPPPLPPSAQIFGLGMAAYVPQMLHVIAEQGIPDLLVDGPRTSADLAATTGLHERSLYRVLRSLAGLGFFTEESRGLFRLTPLGSALTSTDGSGARELMLIVDWWSKAIAEFPRTLETGTSGMQLAFGTSLWEFFEKNPQQGEKFDRAVKGAHAGEKEAVAETYDFSAFHQVVDVAGGTGFLLAEILRRHAQVTGVLFDLPAVIADSTGELDELRDRCETVAGDFFDSVPAGADCYVLSHVIHDWDDDRCLEILHNCRHAMDPNGRLLLVEMVIPPGDDPHPGKMLDMVMLTIPGGMERSEEEYRELLDAAGFRLTQVIPTQTPASVIEAVPAKEQ